MINKCDDCIMSNCCEEFENVGCETIKNYGKAIKSKVIDEFIKDVLIELNALAENDDYYFDKDNANLVSTVLYSQLEKSKGNEE